jgi:hypothetical protein
MGIDAHPRLQAHTLTMRHACAGSLAGADDDDAATGDDADGVAGAEGSGAADGADGVGTGTATALDATSGGAPSVGELAPRHERRTRDATSDGPAARRFTSRS